MVTDQGSYLTSRIGFVGQFPETLNHGFTRRWMHNTVSCRHHCKFLEFHYLRFVIARESVLHDDNGILLFCLSDWTRIHGR